MKIIKGICLIVLIISIPFLHEVGHLIDYILTEVPATIEYGFITSGKITVGGVLGGLLFNYRFIFWVFLGG
ncbi:hypothetical protein [uncultured Clostridium sp.]|jgi:hypothetical protein|uniref:hypothetical protein n=1 Tax=uncultured Clostridium sp. TaxID=59620 RepID=UPI00262E076F|nr:hypothetical protein [uncultured Clostridium sp.]